MISRRLVWAAVDGGHDSRFVPRCGSEDHWNSTRTQILEEASGGQKMSFPTIQYQFHTVLMYVRIFSISYCFLLSKNTVVQNLELRKIQFYRTKY
jgi:hypothetical protein